MEIAKSFTDSTFTAVLSGKFTFFDHAAFDEMLSEIRREDVSSVLLDMAKLTFIDSAGLGQLLLAHDEAAKYSKPLIIKGIAGQVKKMFGVAHFGHLFTLQE